MKCQYCGEELSGGRFCTNCGAPVPENPAAFQTEQQIPEPTMRQIPTPVQQVPEPTEWIPAPTQQTPPQPVPPTQPTGQGAPGKIIALGVRRLFGEYDADGEHEGHVEPHNNQNSGHDKKTPR